MGPWSPDGQSVVIASSRDGDAELYILDANGEGIQQLTDNPATDGNPGWSPCVPGIVDRLAAICAISASNNANLRGAADRGRTSASKEH
jgi:hypothetical protein